MTSQNVVKHDASGKEGKLLCCRCLFDQIRANLAEMQPENHQTCKKCIFWQKALGVNGLKCLPGAKQDGGGRHLTLEEIEENLLEWIFDRCSKGLRVSRKIIIVKAAKFQEEKEKEDPNSTKLTFSQGWLEKFMNRN